MVTVGALQYARKCLLPVFVPCKVQKQVLKLTSFCRVFPPPPFPPSSTSSSAAASSYHACYHRTHNTHSSLELTLITQHACATALVSHSICMHYNTFHPTLQHPTPIYAIISPTHHLNLHSSQHACTTTLLHSLNMYAPQTHSPDTTTPHTTTHHFTSTDSAHHLKNDSMALSPCALMLAIQLQRCSAKPPVENSAPPPLSMCLLSRPTSCIHCRKTMTRALLWTGHHLSLGFRAVSDCQCANCSCC